MAAKTYVSDAADRDIHMPHPIHRIVCTYSHTYIHTYTSPPTSYPYLQTYITFRGVYCLLPPPLSRPVPPHPLLPSLYGRQQRIVSCRCPLFSMGGHVCMQAWLYVCEPGFHSVTPTAVLFVVHFLSLLLLGQVIPL